MVPDSSPIISPAFACTDGGATTAARMARPRHVSWAALRFAGCVRDRAAPSTRFDIQVVNQGESTETDVVVQVTVGQGGDAIKAEETIPEIAAGEAKPVTIPLTRQPPTGQNVPIAVRVKAVPGEEVTDNNVGEFTVIFTR